MGLSKTKLFFLCLGVFLLGFFGLFPFQTLKGPLFKAIFDQSGVVILAEDLRPLVLGWPGIRLKKANASLPLGTESLDLESENVDIRVRLSSFFVPSVSLFFNKLAGEGNLFLQIGTRGDTLFSRVSSKALNLSSLSLPGLDAPLAGSLNTDINFKYNDAIFSQSSGNISIKGTNFTMPAILVNNPMLGPPFQVPKLEVGSIDIDMLIRDGFVKINSFLFGGAASDLRAELSGDAQLGASPQDTQLNLILKLNFSEKISQSLEYKTFLDFLKAYQMSKAGEYGMVWKGRLQDIMNLPLPSPLK